MRRLRVFPVALALALTTVFVGAAPALASGCEGTANCTIWASPICSERVPKAIRVAAGCFDIQP